MDIVKRHVNAIHRAFRRYQPRVGVTVSWYRFDQAGTTGHDVYDEGPSRRWLPPTQVPLLHIVRDEEAQADTEEGLYALGAVHFVLDPRQAQRGGIADPWAAPPQLNDRFFYEGAFWEVRSWQVQGRLRQWEVVVGGNANQVAPEELFEDPGFPPA